MNQLSSRNRIQSIDLLRGIVMVIMALDHTRDFFFKVTLDSASDAALGPTDMNTTFPTLFFTRWITHYCAPIFLLLAGTSIYLMSLKKTKAELSSFLLKRGLFLILIEVIVITLGWTFNPLYNVFILQVIWAIGISMVMMSFIIRLPFKLILALGLIILLGHNLLDDSYIKGTDNGLLNLLYYSKFTTLQYGTNRFIVIVYAFVPWLAIMMLGYCLGKWFESSVDPAWRRKQLLIAGSAITALFFIIRFINVYGDPVPWSEQPRGTTYTILSFFNVNKYPPSLAFLCMTLGPGLIALSLLEKVRGKIAAVINIYGRVPMFYYILHFYILHILVVLFFYLQGHHNHTPDEIVTPGVPFLFRPNDFGLNLWGTYGIWLFTVIMLYPLCKKYDKYKSTHKKWWLSYL